MSRIEWTTDQKTVIGLRGHDMLISAAAGSGKTAVLTERIIGRVFDAHEPVHVDQILVMTYTESAAEEMKQRIRKRLAETADSADPAAAARAREELIRLPQAQISTIHGFCSSVIRSWFNVIDLEPDFRICADEGEHTMLETECLETLLESEYAAGRPEFCELVEAYGGTRDDRQIIEQIRSLHAVSMSFPRPAEWLSDSLRYYETDPDIQFEQSELAELICEQTVMTAEELAGRCAKLLDRCLLPGGPYTYEEAVRDDLEFLREVEAARSWRAIRDLCADHTWGRLDGGKKDESIDPLMRKACQKERNAIKDQFTKQIYDPFYAAPPSETEHWLETACRQGRELVRLTLAFDAAFTAMKRARKIIDFSDMEHLALSILEVSDEAGRKTIAEEYRRHYTEVMVDEYQDSNYLQDEILKAVSGGKDRHNLFMVGDVKQSIYRFRNARPDLFVQKQHQFDLYEQEKVSLLRKTCILLLQNFRSVPQVLDFVNLLFHRLMDADIGEIVYDERAALYPGRSVPEDMPQTPCEVWVVPEDQEDSGVSRAEAEAHCVAERMKALLARGQVVDQQTGEIRPVRYGDIVILSRSLSNWAEEFYEALCEEGIPVFMPRKSGYFQTLEVGTVLDFLRIVGNVRQDLPLAALMTSCIGGFTDSELARIRTAGKQYEFFHEALEAYLKEPEDPELGDKLQAFTDMINSFRERAPYMPVDRLISSMMEETGFRRYMEAMPGGVQRRANLMMLIDKARSFAGTGLRSLTDFLDYIALMDQNNVDYGEAGLFDEQADVVRMTTIHKSKGLEYPIVFLVGMGRGFNKRDLNNKIVVHPQYGLGLCSWDTGSRQKAETPVRQIVRDRLRLDDLGEEMRILYVACTRARERLIMTGCVKDILTRDEISERFDTGEHGGTLPMHIRAQAGCYYDWVLPVMADLERDEGAAEAVKLMFADRDTLARMAAWRAESRQTDTAGDDIGSTASGIKPRELREQIDRQMRYCYPYEKTAVIPQKVTVSELKRRDERQFLLEIGEELSDDGLPAEKAPIRIHEIKPRFAQGKKRLSPAEKGTAHHRLLQLLDFSKEWNEPLLEETVRSFQEQGYFDADEAEAIRVDRVAGILRLDLFRRMGKAVQAGSLRREQPFVIGVPASEIDQSWPADETVLVQGMIDAYFEEDGKLIVLDYKTDRVRAAEELIARYRGQMAWYQRALTQLTGKEVAEKYLVSLELEQVIPV